MTDGDGTRAAAGSAAVAETELSAGAMGLGAVLAQALTHIAPAMGFLTGATFIASQAGYSLSLSYGLAFLVCLSIGLSMIQLTRHLPSAGGYFTYVSRTLHARLGFLTAWLYFLYDPTGAAINFAIVGIIIQQTLQQRLHVLVPWWVVAGAGILFVTAIIYRGVKVSGRALIALAAIEIGILVAFAATSFAEPGPGGFSAKTFTIDPKFGVNGVALGVIFAIFAFTGFESVAPLAEESRNPRRNLSLAVVLSLILMGAFYMFATWGLAVGWGLNTFDATFAGKDVNAFLTLAARIWGWGWLLLLFALLNSAFAVGLATSNAATRVFFSMGRAGALPSWLGRVHPRYKTPSNAIILQTAITILFTFIGGFALGPSQLFFWFGVVITLGLIGVYGLGNVGVIRYYLTERRAEFNWFWHIAIPVISTVAIGTVAYFSLQGLSGLLVTAPWIVLGWLVVGALLLVYARLSGREHWLIKAGEVAYERQATPEQT
jgi:amino acid transporter